MGASNQKRRVRQYCNIQFYQTLNSKKRIIVHQGGTRSGKTYAICQYLIHRLVTSDIPLTITIARKTLPSLKGSVMRDFFEILDNIGLLYVGTHNKAENIYYFKNHIVEFLSVDEPQKIRGRKRDICFVNEGNELTFEDFRQLLMRTTDQMILDFNPSDPIHWIYEEVCTREDCETFITTYLDNKFLPIELIKEIERLKIKDPDYWNVYGLGQKAAFSKRQIFNNWKFIDESEFPEFNEIFYGLDFGFSNDPTAIVQVGRVNDKIFVKELCYSTNMTNKMIYDFFISKGYDSEIVYYDSAEPKSGEELRQLGLMGYPADKGSGSVNAGISLLKEFEIYVSKDSKNLLAEYATYYWQQLKDETIINVPVDKNNHCFVGSTLITTINGQVKISDIKVGDLVLTSNGYKPVLYKFNNGKKIVSKYSMQFDTFVVNLCATEDHKIKTTKGWRKISKLKKGMNLYHFKNLMEKDSIYTQTKIISQKGKKDCILKYGNFIEEIFQKVIMFITLMAILLTIPLKILIWFMQNFIYVLLGKKDLKKILNGLKSFILKELMPLKIGINLMKERNGILNMVKKHGLIELIKILFANNAEKNIKVESQVEVNSVIKTAKLKHFVQEESWEEEVYDLMVLENHEYFANNILVHNCMDALRYAVYTKYKSRTEFFVI